MAPRIAAAICVFLFNSQFLYCQQPMRPPSQEHVLRFGGEDIAMAPASSLLELTTQFTLDGGYSTQIVIINASGGLSGLQRFVSRTGASLPLVPR